MSKVIDFLGNTDDGGLCLDIQLHPKRIKDFKPFELDKYNEVLDFVNKNHTEANLGERLEIIDKLLFDNMSFYEKLNNLGFIYKRQKL